jgi:hypothetical protein
MGEMRNAYRIVVGKHQGKRLLGKPMSRWEGSIITCLKEIGWGKCRLVSYGSGEGPVTGSCEHDNKPSVSIIDCGLHD